MVTFARQDLIFIERVNHCIANPRLFPYFLGSYTKLRRFLNGLRIGDCRL